MTKAKALERLARCCTLNDGFIYSKGGPPYRSLGGIQFSDGKVEIISKNHGQYKQAVTFEFALKLYRIISGIGKNATVFLSVQNEEISNADMHYIDLSFPGGKLLRLTIGRMDRGPISGYVDITEELHAAGK